MSADGVTASWIVALVDRHPLAAGTLTKNPAVLELGRLVHEAGDDVDALSNLCDALNVAAGPLPAVTQESKLRGIVLRAIGLALRWPENQHGWIAANALAEWLVGAGTQIGEDDLGLVDEVLALRDVVPIRTTFLDLGLIVGNRIPGSAVLDAVSRSPIDPCLVLAAGCRSLSETDVHSLLRRVDRGEWIIDYIDGPFGTDELIWADWDLPFRHACEWQDGPSDTFWHVLLKGLSENSGYMFNESVVETLVIDYSDYDLSWLSGTLQDHPDQLAAALSSRWLPAVLAGATATRDPEVLQRLALDSRAEVRHCVASNPAASDEIRALCALGE